MSPAADRLSPGADEKMNWLLQRLAKTVTIEVSPERFVFHYDGKSVEFAPRVWLSGDRIEGVGLDGPAGSDAVELFGDRPAASNAPNRAALLGAVVQYGVCQVIGKGIYIVRSFSLRGCRLSRRFSAGIRRSSSARRSRAFVPAMCGFPELGVSLVVDV